MKSLLTNLAIAIVAISVYVLCFYFQARSSDYPTITYFVMLFLGNIYSLITAIIVFIIARKNQHIWKSFWLFTSLLLNLIGCIVLIEWCNKGIQGVSYFLITMYSILPIIIISQFIFVRNYIKNYI